MGRPTVLTPRMAAQLSAMLGCGITQQRAGLAVGVSTRTVSRFVARRRKAKAETLEELLDGLPPLEDVLADVYASLPSVRRNDD